MNNAVLALIWFVLGVGWLLLAAVKHRDNKDEIAWHERCKAIFPNWAGTPYIASWKPDVALAVVYFALSILFFFGGE